jgi:hypothetical protein
LNHDGRIEAPPLTKIWHLYDLFGGVSVVIVHRGKQIFCNETDLLNRKLFYHKISRSISSKANLLFEKLILVINEM